MKKASPRRDACDNYEVDRVAGDAWVEVNPDIVTLADFDEMRSEQIGRCFEGLEMVEPGLVSLTQGRPDTAEVGTVEPVDGYGAVARKP